MLKPSTVTENCGARAFISRMCWTAAPPGNQRNEKLKSEESDEMRMK